MRARRQTSQPSVPLWRDTRVLRIVGQVLFLLAIGAVLFWLGGNLRSNLAASGLNLEFRFLGNTASFPISEGIAYDETQSNGYAFWVGVVNTLRVASLGIVFATLIGTIVGIARLSSNWIVRKLAGFYVETVRNIPLLVQLFFWYFAVILTALPLVSESLRLPGGIYLSRRGVFLPRLLATASFDAWRWFVVGGVAIGIAVYVVRRRHLRRTDRPGVPFIWALGALIICSAIGWGMVRGAPLGLELPVFQRFNFEGGSSLSAPFLALLIALSTYTGAFIAEIVRGGIQAVNRGQSEAARALGFRRLMLLRLVILPQAMRIIIPPLGSQFLNLTKNSSLAILIGYYDLMNVGTTIFNQTGRAVEMILLIMGAYLSISLFISVLTNLYNRRMRLVER